MRKLTSSKNAYVKQMRSLYTRRGRKKTGLMPVEGIRFLQEAVVNAMQGKTAIESVFYVPDLEERPGGSDLLSQIEKVASRVFCCTPEILHYLTDTETPQGIVAAVRQPWTKMERLPARDGGFYLVLDRVQDPGNLGTMIRTAAAAGVDAVVCIKGTVDPFNPKVLRATMGAIFTIPVVFYDEPGRLVKHLRQQDCRLVAADVEAARCHFEVAYTGGTAIIIGNEARGVDPWLLSIADATVKIPLARDTESLNAAVAAGILLYEVVRTRQLQQKQQERWSRIYHL